MKRFVGIEIDGTEAKIAIIDQEKGEKVVFYQVDLELVDMRNNRKVWLGNKKIKSECFKSFG